MNFHEHRLPLIIRSIIWRIMKSLKRYFLRTARNNLADFNKCFYSLNNERRTMNWDGSFMSWGGVETAVFFREISFHSCNPFNRQARSKLPWTFFTLLFSQILVSQQLISRSSFFLRRLFHKARPRLRKTQEGNKKRW